MSKKITIVTLSIFVLGALGGCFTGYQKKSFMSEVGYTDEKISEGVYKVKYLVTAFEPEGNVLKFWHKRAAELCGSTVYENDAVQKFKTRESYNPGIATYQTHRFPYVIGTVRCKNN